MTLPLHERIGAGDGLVRVTAAPLDEMVAAAWAVMEHGGGHSEMSFDRV